MSPLFSQKEKGQGLGEYALLLALIALTVLVVFIFLGPSIGNVFSNIMENPNIGGP